MDQQGIRPLLGRKACLGMKIVAYLDNDQLNKPNTEDGNVYAVGDAESPVTKEQLVKKYPSVFADGVGLLEGEYHIRLDPQAKPVQHALRRVPVALRDRLQETLCCMNMGSSPKTGSGEAEESCVKYTSLAILQSTGRSHTQSGLGVALLQNGQPVAYV